MQVYKGTRYIMSRAGSVFDSQLNLIKKTRNCTSNPKDPTYGQPISVFDL